MLTLVFAFSLSASGASPEKDSTLASHWECTGAVYEGIMIPMDKNAEIRKFCEGVSMDFLPVGRFILSRGLQFFGTMEESENTKSDRQAFTLTIDTVAEFPKDDAEAPSAPYEGAPFMLSMTSDTSCILMGLDAANSVIGEYPLIFEAK